MSVDLWPAVIGAVLVAIGVYVLARGRGNGSGRR